MIADWPSVPLGSVVAKSDNWIEVAPTEEYTELTVHLWGRGISPRRIAQGSELAGSRRLQVRQGEFIVSRIDARHGASGIIPDHLHGAVVSNDFPVYRPDGRQLLPDYLGWFSRTHDFVDSCRAASEGTTNRVRLKEEEFANIEIPLPPLEEQRRIVAKIERLAAKIEETRGLRHDAEMQAGALLRSGAEAAFQQLSSEVGCTVLSDVCESITDGDHNTPTFVDEGVPFIFVGNVSSGRLHFENSKQVSEPYFDALGAQSVAKPGDILYSAVGATLGVPAIVNTDARFCFQRHIAILNWIMVQWIRDLCVTCSGPILCIKRRGPQQRDQPSPPFHCVPSEGCLSLFLHYRSSTASSPIWTAFRPRSTG